MSEIRNKWQIIDSDSTMFDFQDYYQSVAESVPDGARLVEVGISNGKSLIYLCEALLNLGKTFRLVGIDNLDYGRNNQLTEIVKNIGIAGLGEYIEFYNMSSLDASCMFNDGYLHHVFIDSSHKYQQTMAEARLWYRKIMDGWLLSGHDYLSNENSEVRQAIDEVITADRLLIQNTSNGSGIWSIKKDDNLPFL